jgi:hypothetical protein
MCRVLICLLESPSPRINRRKSLAEAGQSEKVWASKKNYRIKSVKMIFSVIIIRQSGIIECDSAISARLFTVGRKVGLSKSGRCSDQDLISRSWLRGERSENITTGHLKTYNEDRMEQQPLDACAVRDSLPEHFFHSSQYIDYNLSSKIEIVTR